MALDALWGSEARTLRQRLGDARTPARRFRILEHALLGRLGRRRPGHPAVPIAIARLAQPDVSVAGVTTSLGLSHRRLIEVFTAEVGVGPKLFARVQRFQRALGAARASTAPNWAEIAVTCGYYDQAHLIRDYVAFAALSPSQLARRRADRVKVNHVALPDRRRSNSSNTS